MLHVHVYSIDACAVMTSKPVSADVLVILEYCMWFHHYALVGRPPEAYSSHHVCVCVCVCGVCVCVVCVCVCVWVIL